MSQLYIQLSGGGRRIFVVDDEADARELLARFWGRAGADVIVVASADEAFETLQRWRSDVLVSDIGVPGDERYVLIRRVRTLRPDEGGQVRALALTATRRSENPAHSRGFHIHIARRLTPWN
jgi:CheY-like chemotaxis protein